MPTNDLASRLEHERALLRQRPECEFTSRATFADHLLSRRSLERCDDAKAGVRGIRDPVTRKRYLIEEEKLFGEA